MVVRYGRGMINRNGKGRTVILEEWRAYITTP